MARAKLPPELWIQIIREAGYVPPCDMSDYDPLPPTGSHNIHSGKVLVLVREAISTKYAISLVCRFWNTIVVEFLYDFIIVRDAIHIPLLIDQLSRVGTRISSKVQQLDFAFAPTTCNIAYNGVSYSAKQLAIAAANLISLCPRLRALSSPTTLWERHDEVLSRTYAPFLAEALIQVKDTLECLNWHCRWSHHSAIFLRRLFLPRLKLLLQSSETTYLYASSSEYFHWNDISADLTDEVPFDGGSVMMWTCSPLHTMDLEYYESWRTFTADIPKPLSSSLRHMVISQDQFCFFQTPENWSLLSQVNTITFRDEGFCHFINQRCFLPPSIHTIIFHVQDFPSMPPIFPYIKRIGLIGTKALAQEEYDYAFNLLVGSEESLFPGLGMIRLVDAFLPEVFGERELLKLWGHRCQLKGIRLEDEMGHSVAPDLL